MDRYFYHGIEAYPGVMGWAVQLMIKILNEGIIVRNQARNFNDDRFNHVCLYRKNEEYDYEGKEGSLNSARDGWIDDCFVFVVSPEIEARKATSEETNHILMNILKMTAFKMKKIDNYLEKPLKN